MMPGRRLSIKVIVVILVYLSPSIVHASALRNPNQSASAAGQGTAFAAQADDPSAIYYNPAGMTQLRGVQNQGGLSLIGGGISFRSTSGASGRGDLGDTIAIPPPIHAYLTANLKDLGIAALGDTTVGIGITNPFGLQTRYPANAHFSTAATSAIFPLLDIKPTVAYRVNEDISLGLGADIYTFVGFAGGGKLAQEFNWPGGAGLPPGTPTEVNGRDTALGFNVSMLYTPFRNSEGKPLANVGLVYRSQATLHLHGQFRANNMLLSDASTTLVLPQILTAAVAVWPLRDMDHEWKLEMDIDYTGWRSVRNLDVHLSSGGTLPAPQNWRSNFTVMLGTEYRWLQVPKMPEWEFAVRGGYLHSLTPIPDSTFTPAIPDADQHIVSVGIGTLCKPEGSFFGIIPCGIGSGKFRTQAMGMDVAYAAMLFENRTVTGNLNPTVNGTYRTTEHSGTVTFRVSF
jgi:long-chain fatty acid transport protein